MRRARRWVAIDLGDRRIGLAVSDPTGMIASPAGHVVRRAGKRPPLTALLARVRELEGEGLVVGLPLDGGVRTRRVRRRRDDWRRNSRPGLAFPPSWSTSASRRRRHCARCRRWRVRRAAGRATWMRWRRQCCCSTRCGRWSCRSRRPSPVGSRMRSAARWRRFCVATGVAMVAGFAAACGTDDRTQVTVNIRKGSNFPEAAESLAAHGVIENPRLFGFYASRLGRDRSIRYGMYLLERGSSWNDVLDALEKGEGMVTRVRSSRAGRCGTSCRSSRRSSRCPRSRCRWWCATRRCCGVCACHEDPGHGRLSVPGHL